MAELLRNASDWALKNGRKRTSMPTQHPSFFPSPEKHQVSVIQETEWDPAAVTRQFIPIFQHVLVQSKRPQIGAMVAPAHDETGNGGLVGLTSHLPVFLVSVGVLADPAGSCRILHDLLLSHLAFETSAKLGDSFLSADHLGWISAAFAAGRTPRGGGDDGVTADGDLGFSPLPGSWLPEDAAGTRGPGAQQGHMAFGGKAAGCRDFVASPHPLFPTTLRPSIGDRPVET